MINLSPLSVSAAFSGCGSGNSWLCISLMLSRICINILLQNFLILLPYETQTCSTIVLFFIVFDVSLFTVCQHMSGINKERQERKVGALVLCEGAWVVSPGERKQKKHVMVSS